MQYDPELINALEADQRSAAAQRPLPRRILGTGTLVLLVLLRIYVVIAIPIVAYAFIHVLVATRR